MSRVQGADTCFQSQLGSIGALDHLDVPIFALPPFNPSLVRLAPICPTVRERLRLLSIPAWFDWRPRSRWPTLLPLPFQSQLGSIGAEKEVEKRLQEKTLSIPAWFDWRFVRRGDAARYLLTFNPSLVRLAPSPADCEQSTSPSFNPSLVRLARALTLAIAIASLFFQSQLGSIGALVALFATNAFGILSIPAWFDWRFLGLVERLDQDPTFNPSLVRLAQYSPDNTRATGSPFNPSLVRLAPVDAVVDDLLLDTFQSQLGSIGALDLSLIVLNNCPFNPSLVRLAQGLDELVPDAEGVFQSQLGSIGAAASIG